MNNFLKLESPANFDLNEKLVKQIQDACQPLEFMKAQPEVVRSHLGSLSIFDHDNA